MSGNIRVRILGIGGCVSSCPSYNAFLVNDDLLVETPPDVMASLNRQKVDLGPIDRVFISHPHGDHSFGLPFLIINKWIQGPRDGRPSRLTLIAPKSVIDQVPVLLSMAFTSRHPVVEWARKWLQFQVIDGSSDIGYSGWSMRFFPLEHLVETFGFKLVDPSGGTALTYICDSRWCNGVEEQLKGLPRMVMIDANGGGMHISLDEILERGIGITGNRTRYVGTHVFQPFVSAHPQVICAADGLTLEVPSAEEGRL